MSPRYGIALALGLLFGAPSVVEAQAVEIGDISGGGGRAVERQLREALEEAGVQVGAGAPVVVTGRFRRRGRRLTLNLTIGADSVRVSRRGTGELISEAVSEIRSRIGGAAAPPPPPPDEPPARAADRARRAPDRSATPAPAPAPALGPGGEWAGEDALEFGVGVDWMARVFTFADDIFDRIGEYTLLAAPVARAWARWFPAHHWTSDILSGFGVNAEVFGAFGLDSRTQDGLTTFPTTVDAWNFGFLWRGRIVEPLRIEVQADYGEHRFRIDPAGPVNPASSPDPIPSVRYQYLRPGLAMQVDLPEGFSIRGQAGWRSVLNAGEFGAEWFPRSFTTGVDLGLSVYWRFNHWFGARIHVEHTRYITAINPQVGDALVAGGALDEWTRAGGDFIVYLPGAR